MAFVLVSSQPQNGPMHYYATDGSGMRTHIVAPQKNVHECSTSERESVLQIISEAMNVFASLLDICGL